MSNSNKLALITGASRGLGRSMALHLADAGIDVLGTYYSKEAEAREVVAEVEKRGARAAMLQLDAGNASSFGDFAASVKQTLADTFGRTDFDHLVNNAGTGIHAPFTETTEDGFDLMVALHYKGPYFLTQALLPLIADGGRILNVSSGLTRFSFPGYSAYAAAKGAIETATTYMALELAPRNITVNVIAPGAIETDFGGGAVRDNAELNQMIATNTALGRVGLPDDIGGAVAALLTDGLNWVTGQRIEASGGFGL
ncbi:MAG: SDR family oxidoreductase [Acidobacteriota bacterium]